VAPYSQTAARLSIGLDLEIAPCGDCSRSQTDRTLALRRSVVLSACRPRRAGVSLLLRTREGCALASQTRPSASRRGSEIGRGLWSRAARTARRRSAGVYGQAPKAGAP